MWLTTFLHSCFAPLSVLRIDVTFKQLLATSNRSTYRTGSSVKLKIIAATFLVRIFLFFKKDSGWYDCLSLCRMVLGKNPMRTKSQVGKNPMRKKSQRKKSHEDKIPEDKIPEDKIPSGKIPKRTKSHKEKNPTKKYSIVLVSLEYVLRSQFSNVKILRIFFITYPFIAHYLCYIKMERLTAMLFFPQRILFSWDCFKL